MKSFQYSAQVILTTAILIFFGECAMAQLNYQWIVHMEDGSGEAKSSHGVLGVTASSNNPGARENAMTWNRNDGNLWLYGGINYINIDGNTVESVGMGDLWKYNPDLQQWTWISGSKLPDPDAVYGQKGILSSEYTPGRRYYSASWTGKDGTFWLFGGSTTEGTKNDLWKYDPDFNRWGWVSGSSEWGAPSVYGTIGVPADTTVPGARTNSVSWTDPNGNLWLMGGMRRTNTNISGGSSSGQVDDLWKFNISTEQWTWVDGEGGIALPVYGDKGVPSNFVTPGSRSGAMGWVGPDGNLWFFGGSISYRGNYNDLFKFDITTSQWSWVSGAAVPSQSGNYGLLGVESASNQPGARSEAKTWTDPEGNFWLYGGNGRDENGDGGELADLWKFNVSTEQWTWMGGSKTVNSAVVYGELGIPSSSANPGVKTYSQVWVDYNGFPWLYGGNRQGEMWQLVSESGVANFDGTTSIGKVNAADDLSLSMTSEVTVEAWVRVETVTAGGYSTILSRGGITQGLALTLNTNVSGTSIIFTHFGGSASITNYEWTDFSTNEWYHLAASYEDGSAKIYVDGELRLDSPVAGSLSDPTNGLNDLFLSYDEILSTGYLDGQLAEVRLWNKALTQAEIQTNMNLSVSGKEPNLMGSWLPRTAGRHSAVDQTGKGNNVAFTNVDYTTDFPPIKASITGTEGWRFLGAPGGSTTYGSLLNPIWTQGFIGSNAGTGPTSNVYFYDETSKSWQVPGEANNVVGTNSGNEEGIGKGALVYVYADDDNDGIDDPFPKTLQLDSFGSVAPTQIPLSYTDSGIYGNDGWNLVSNPYPVALYWQKVVDDGANNSTLDYAYIWDQDLNGGAGGYQIHYGEPVPPSFPGGTNSEFDGRIPAFQSFWVKAKEVGANLQFQASQFIPNQEFYKNNQVVSPHLKFTLKGNDFTDELSVIIPASEDRVRDEVPKLNSLSGQYAEIYLPGEKGTRWMTHHLNSVDNDVPIAIPIAFETSMSGTFTLSWDAETLPEGWTAILHDKDNEVSYDLSEISEINIKSDNSSYKSGNELTIPVAPVSQVQKKNSTPRFELELTSSVTTGIVNENNLPEEFILDQNYPNPFNPTTQINYSVPERADIQLSVFDILGRKVSTLVNENKAPGRYSVTFDASSLSSGMYIYRLNVGSTVITKQMTLIK